MKKITCQVIEDNDTLESHYDLLLRQEGIEEVQGFGSCESALLLMDSREEAHPDVIFIRPRLTWDEWFRGHW